MEHSNKRETNEMELLFDARSENEGFARVAVASFITEMNPTLEEVSDVKTAVSEAVTNAIIHGYPRTSCMKISEVQNKEVSEGDGEAKEESVENRRDKIRLHCRIEGDKICVSVEDKGVGIEDVSKAMEPLYTSKPELERSGMGFAFMEAFMDTVQVYSVLGEGTRVVMEKTLGKDSE